MTSRTSFSDYPYHRMSGCNYEPGIPTVGSVMESPIGRIIREKAKEESERINRNIQDLVYMPVSADIKLAQRRSDDPLINLYNDAKAMIEDRAILKPRLLGIEDKGDEVTYVYHLNVDDAKELDTCTMAVIMFRTKIRAIYQKAHDAAQDARRATVIVVTSEDTAREWLAGNK